ncbi:MBL fold metallo-hydrolase [Lysobacter antibioticus]|nr:MBL fold metallo-hydrolase [Lysobacter antibioticus]
MRTLLAVALMTTAAQAWSTPVTGSLGVRWNAGAPDCAATPQPPLQVQAYEPQTVILRQSPCADFEANFLYLLIGSDRALLIDTGAVADPDRMPLAKTVLDLLPSKDGAKLPLLIVHSHGHADHRAGDAQFASLPSVRIAPTELPDAQTFLGLGDWPNGVARIDLGGRSVEAIATPGHHPSHMSFYDGRTGLFFSGDFLLPGRLLIDDIDAYRDSALRAAEFLKARPVAHILGGHIELGLDGQAYPHGAQHHPRERPLQLSRQDLLALPAALDGFNGFYARHPTFILSNPVRDLLAIAAGVLVLLALSIYAVRGALRRRRQRAQATTR